MDTRNDSWYAFCHCGLGVQALSVGKASGLGHDICPELEGLFPSKDTLEGYDFQSGVWPNSMTVSNLTLLLWLQQAHDWTMLHGTGKGETEGQLCAL